MSLPSDTSYRRLITRGRLQTLVVVLVTLLVVTAGVGPAVAVSTASGDATLSDSTDPPADRTELAVVDTSVAGHETLARTASAEGIEVVRVDGARDLRSALADRSGLDAIHLLSHGNRGRLHLGDDDFSADGPTAADATLRALGDSLAVDGDLLLYGCRIGTDAGDDSFVTRLAAVTGADVAASTDLTGTERLGGDWDLEREVGRVDTASLTADDYSGLLLGGYTTIPAGSSPLSGFSDSRLRISGATEMLPIDYDGDGDTDFIVADSGSNFNLLENDGSGGFTERTGVTVDLTLTTVDNFVVVDYDDDGDPDIVDANAGAESEARILRNDGGGTFTTLSAGSSPLSGFGNSRLAIGGTNELIPIDWDGDGDTDFVTADTGAGWNLLENDGSGGFTERTGVSIDISETNAINILVVDYDGDGDPDIVDPMVDSANDATVLRNDGGGSFTTLAPGSGSPLAGFTNSQFNVSGNRELLPIDYDVDGDTDFLVADSGSGWNLLENDGTGGFTEQTGVAGDLSLDTANEFPVVDYDDDGDPDIVDATAGTDQNAAILENGASPPALIANTPADGTTDFPANADIVLEFDETVSLGTGDVVIRRVSDDSPVATADVTTSAVTLGSGTQVTVDPSSDLPTGVDLYVHVEPGAITDGDGEIPTSLTDDPSTLNFVAIVPNDPPTFVDASPSVSVPEDGGPVSVDAGLTASDPDGDALTWEVASAPDHGTLAGFPTTVSSGTTTDTDPSGLSYEPDADFAGSDSFEVRVVDAVGDSDTITVSATVADAPEVASITRAGAGDETNADSLDFDVAFSTAVQNVDTGDFTLTTTGDATGTVSAVDASAGSSITVTVGSLAGDGTVRLDLADDDSITGDDVGAVPLGGVGTTGAGDGSATGDETYTLDNTGPTFDSAPSASILEGRTGTLLDVQADDDAGTAYDTDVSYALSGTDAGPFSLDSGTGSLSIGTPLDYSSPTDANADNDYELTVTATDDAGNTATQSVVVSVTEDTSIPTVLPADSDPANGDYYVSGDPITVRFSEPILLGSAGTVTITDETSGTVAETFDVQADAGSGPGTVSVSDANLTIRPSSALADRTDYAVDLSAGAVVDRGQNPIPAFDGTDTLQFTALAGDSALITTAPDFDTTTGAGIRDGVTASASDQLLIVSDPAHLTSGSVLDGAGGDDTVSLSQAGTYDLTATSQVTGFEDVQSRADGDTTLVVGSGSDDFDGYTGTTAHTETLTTTASSTSLTFVPFTDWERVSVTGTDATLTVTTGVLTDLDSLDAPGAASGDTLRFATGSADATGADLTGFETVAVGTGGDTRLVIDRDATRDVTAFDTGDTAGNDSLVTTDAELNVSGRSLGGFDTLQTTNASGTTFVVDDAGTRTLTEITGEFAASDTLSLTGTAPNLTGTDLTSLDTIRLSRDATLTTDQQTVDSVTTLAGSDGTEGLTTADETLDLSGTQVTSVESLASTSVNASSFTVTDAQLGSLTTVTATESGSELVTTGPTLDASTLTVTRVDTFRTTDASGTVIIGTATPDTLVGFDGDDSLVGGTGADTLTGNAGVDEFGGTPAGLDRDTITDFGDAGTTVDAESIVVTGDATAATEGEYARVTQSGGDSVVTLDTDVPSADTFDSADTRLTLTGITIDSLRVETDAGDAVLTVNSPPTTADFGVTTDEDTRYVFAVGDVPFDDPNPGDTLQQVTFTGVAGDGSLFLDANADDRNDGEELTTGDTVPVGNISAGDLQYAPPANASGDALATATFTVGDGVTTAATDATLTVDVTAVNDAPRISGSPTASVAQDQQYRFTPTATDVDTGDTLTFSGTGVPDWASVDPATGELAGTPGPTDVATYDGIELVVTDSAGATDTLGPFSITVTNVNDAPTITNSPATTAPEDAAYSFVPSVTDPDAGDTTTFAVTALPSWASFDTATGELSGTPTNADVGSYDDIEITVTDAAGATDTVGPVSITVTNTNDAPTATDEQYAVGANSTLSVSAPGLLTNATDPDAGDSLSVEQTPVTAPTNGSVTLSAGGSFDYDPDGTTGPDTFTYRVRDGNGGTDTATVTIDVRQPTFAVNVTDTNDPVTEGDTLVVNATVANTGSLTDTQRVDLRSEVDGVVNTTAVTLAPNASTRVSLVWPTSRGDSETGNVTVASPTDADRRAVEIRVRSSGGGGGGGGGGDPGDGEADNWPRIIEAESDIRAEMAVPTGVRPHFAVQDRLPVNRLEPAVAEFADNSSVASVRYETGTTGTVTVAEFDRPTSLTDATPGRVLTAFLVGAAGDAERTTATMRLRIPTDRLTDGGLTSDDLRVAHYEDDEWTLLDPTVVRQRNGVLLVEIETDGFSPFAVTAVGDPTADFVTPSSATVGEELTLDAGDTTTRFGEIVAYQWSVDGRTLTGETGTLTFDAPGEYGVTLTVTDDTGRTATATRTLVVREQGETPTATATPTATSEPTTTTTPGFGVLVALLALLSLVAVALVARRD
ncbi:DUF4347 domain-containing protein [Salinirubrum litoreum]|uniref:DUF4347 domain-containing protein n=1 Tax=Salinirubrum litoreum TaxID=1126234 RepID=A0ABD5RG71_9EURY|nr:DUF4347 domain-containing protein [Salinirubrum litoreum]